MITPVVITIPGRPKPWQRTRSSINRRTGRIIVCTSPEMRKQQNVIKAEAVRAMAGRAPLVGPLRLEVLAVYAVPKSWPQAKQDAAKRGLVWKTSKPDWDNLAKQEDALNGIVFGDDAQIVRASVGKRYGHPERTEIRVSVMEDLFCDHTDNAVFKAWWAKECGAQEMPLTAKVKGGAGK